MSLKKGLLTWLLFILCSYQTWAVKPDSASVPAAIRLPDLTNTDQKLYFLNAIQKRYPGIFEGAANFDVDLLKLLQDHQTLVEKLLENPEYEKAFEKRSLLNLTIKPTTPFDIKYQRINPTAVQEWKAQLREAFNELPRWSPFETIAEGLVEIMADNHLGLELRWKVERARKKARDSTSPILQWGVKKDRNEVNEWTEFFKGLNSEKDLTKRLQTVAEELERRISNADSSADKIQLLKGQREKVEIAIDDQVKLHGLEEQAKIIDQTQEENVFKQQVATAQLYSFLRKKLDNFKYLTHSDENLEKIKDAINALGEDDLVYFADRDATKEQLKPVIDILYPTRQAAKSQDAESAEQFIDHIHRNIQKFSNQLRTYQETVENTVKIEEIPPPIAILRGMISGDCASRYSFPYPNDPNERVFVVNGSDGERRGTLSATVLEVDTPSGRKEKGLYLITIAGQKMRAGDVELIFQGLEKVKGELGVDHIVLPEAKNIPALINYSTVAGIYLKHIRENKGTQRLHYQKQPIRKAIEDFQSDFNTGNYDHMDHNQQGVIFNPKTVHAVEVSSSKIEAPELKPVPMSADEIIQFALDQHAARRFSVVDAILKTSNISQKVSPEKFTEVLNLLENGPIRRDVGSPFGENQPTYLRQNAYQLKSSLPVAEFEAKVTRALRELGITDLEKKRYLLYHGRLKAPDAFSKENIELTAQGIAKDIQLNPEQPKAGWELIGTHRELLAGTPSIRTVIEKYKQDLNSSDDRRAAFAAIVLLTYLQPKSEPFTSAHRKPCARFLDFAGNPITLLQFELVLTHPSSLGWTEEKAKVRQKLEEELKVPPEYSRISGIIDGLFKAEAMRDPGNSKVLDQLLEKLFHWIENAELPPKTEAPFWLFGALVTIANDNSTDHARIKSRLFESMSKLILKLPRDELGKHGFGTYEQNIGFAKDLERVSTHLTTEAADRLIRIYIENLIKVTKSDRTKLYQLPLEFQSPHFKKHIFNHLASDVNGQWIQATPKNLMASKTWIAIAKLLELVQNEPRFKGVYEDFKKKPLSKITNVNLSVSECVELAEFLLHTPNGNFWPEEQTEIKDALERFVNNSIVYGPNYVALWNYFHSHSDSDQGDLKLLKIQQNLESLLSGHFYPGYVDWIPLAQHIASGPAYLSGQQDRLKAVLKRKLFEEMSKRFNPPKEDDLLIELKKEPLYSYWSKEMPVIEKALSLNKLDRMVYLEEHWPISDCGSAAIEQVLDTVDHANATLHHGQQPGHSDCNSGK